MDGFEFTEDQVSIASGISVSLLKSVRKNSMVKGGHWMEDGDGIRYSESGVNLLMAIAEISGEKLPPQQMPPPPEEESPEPPDEAVFTVTTFYTNKRLLGAVQTPGGPVQRVRVKTSLKFKRGMKIPCSYLQDDLWLFKGRCPRWPGKF